MSHPFKKKRIAVILPVEYRGGSLKAAKLVAEAIYLGSQQAEEAVEVVFGYLDDPSFYSDDNFVDLPSSIKRRSYKWKVIDRSTARTALLFSNNSSELKSLYYQIPDDGMNYFMDCSLLVFVSDRIFHPIIPLIPYVIISYDCLQRYEQVMSTEHSHKFIDAAHKAKKVLVTTEFTRQDLLQFFSLEESKVVKCPMLNKALIPKKTPSNALKEKYFLWTTNLGSHKNHKNAFEALRIYYDRLDGKLECRVTGVHTDKMLSSDLPALRDVPNIVATSIKLQENVRILGELSIQQYYDLLSYSTFLWHPARIDNGTFSVIEAAMNKVPSLSSDYPAMREIEKEFDLSLMYMNSKNPLDMAHKLKQMELEAPKRSELMQDRYEQEEDRFKRNSILYWNAIRDCI